VTSGSRKNEATIGAARIVTVVNSAPSTRLSTKTVCAASSTSSWRWITAGPSPRFCSTAR
jgi:hypothetical protein